MGNLRGGAVTVALIILPLLVYTFVSRRSTGQEPEVKDSPRRIPTQYELSLQQTLALPEDVRRNHAEKILEAVRRDERKIERGGGNGERGERKLIDTAAKLGLTAPPLNSGPSMAVVNMSFYRWESVSPPPVVDWRKTSAITPILSQYVCASCWAIAAVDSIAMMWAIANNVSADPVSPQQVCDCATKQCCQGGWPDWAFSYVLFNGGITSNANYPYLAYDSATCLLDAPTMPTTAQITGWELVPAFDRVALMQAVSTQPVVAFISASSSGNFSTYKSYNALNIFDGVCSTEVNHAVVVVGFNYTGPDLNGSYWILKNSWYPTWGDRGYMYLAMIPDVRGKCGILSTPAMYPVYYPSGPQPARFSSDKRGKWNIAKVDDLSSSLFASSLSTSTSLSTFASTTASISSSSLCSGIINPCGGGSCYMSFGIARCNCSLLASMVEVIGVPTSKCVPRSPCTTSAVNPCRGGTCMDVGDGTYTCSCTAGYAIGAAVDGSPTCLPAVGLAKSYVTLPGDNCTTVSTAFNISSVNLTTFNPFINCFVTEYLPPGIALTVSPVVNPSSTYCTSTYTVRPPDTCVSIANNFFGGSLTALAAMNPGITCKRLFKSQQVCLQMAASSNTSALQCGQSVPVVTGDTCASITVKYVIDKPLFLSINPGLNWNLPPAVGSYVCVAPNTTATTINCTDTYRVMQGDTCPSIWNGANLTMSMFLAINPGIQCQAPYFTIGQQVCIDSPILATMQKAPNVSYSYHTVRTSDTLSIISSVYISRCTAVSVSPVAIAAANFIANLTAPLAVGTGLLIPCIGRIGIVDASECSISVPVCGADFVSYLSYCHALSNFAVPTYQYGSGCYGCGAACTGRMGLPPLSNSGCNQAICPYPTWFGGSTTAPECTQMVPGDTSQCCTFRNITCDRECKNSAATIGGTATQRTANYNLCMKNCMCCEAAPCRFSTCEVSSSCWNDSPRSCTYSNYKYWAICDPLPIPLP